MQASLSTTEGIIHSAFLRVGSKVFLPLRPRRIVSVVAYRCSCLTWRNTMTPEAFILIVLLLAVIGHSLEIGVRNEDVIYDRDVDSVLTLNIHFLNTDEVRWTRGYSKLCLTIDGRACKCYEDYLTSDIVLPTECISNRSHWFALVIMPLSLDINGLFGIRTISHPLFVPALESSHTPDSWNENQRPPHQLPFENLKLIEDSKITLILPVTIDDLSRCAVLFQSLQLMSEGVIFEMLVFVPDHQQDILTIALHGFSQLLTFKVSVIAESVLFKQKLQKSVYPYAIQMAVKLLSAKMVKTEFYMTLDADVVLLQPFNIDQILIKSNITEKIEDGVQSDDYVNKSNRSKSVESRRNQGKRRALYDHEERYLHHPHWWIGSEAVLNVRSVHPELQGFGVTPALLSTYASLLTVAAVEEAYIMKFQREIFVNCMQNNENNSNNSMSLPLSDINTDTGSEVEVEVEVEIEVAVGVETEVEIDLKTNKSQEQSQENIREKFQDFKDCNNDFSTDKYSDQILSVQAESLWLEEFGLKNVLWSEYTLYNIVLDHYQVGIKLFLFLFFIHLPTCLFIYSFIYFSISIAISLQTWFFFFLVKLVKYQFYAIINLSH